MNVLANMFIDEAKGIHKYKLDKSYYFRAINTPDHLRKVRSTPKMKLSYTGLIADNKGNLKIGLKKPKKQ